MLSSKPHRNIMPRINVQKRNSLLSSKPRGKQLLSMASKTHTTSPKLLKTMSELLEEFKPQG